MSSNTYTLKIDIDDSKIRELERRLMAAMGGKMSGMSGIQNAAKGGGAGKGIAGNIAKLGIIAIGVGSLVMLVSKLMNMIVDSSPMLKQMLKLLNFSVMLILRPIGDFIGFFLKPVIMYFLRDVVIPWYKEWRKPAMQAGLNAGQDFLDDPLGSYLANNAATSPLMHLDEIENAITGAGLSINLWVSKAFSDFTMPTFDWLSTQTFLDYFSVDKLPTFDWTGLETLLGNFSLDNLPTFDWFSTQTFLDYFSVDKLPTFDWTGLETGLESIKTEVKKFIDSIIKVFTDIIALIPGIGSGGGGDGGVTNNFIDINGNGIDDAIDATDEFARFTDWITGKG